MFGLNVLVVSSLAVGLRLLRSRFMYVFDAMKTGDSSNAREYINTAMITSLNAAVFYEIDAIKRRLESLMAVINPKIVMTDKVYPLLFSQIGDRLATLTRVNPHPNESRGKHIARHFTIDE